MRAVRSWPALLVAGFLVLALGSNFRAGDGKEERAPAKPKDLDSTLYRGLKGAINQGVDLYQAGDHYGCYRLFQGLLLTLKPVLADQPGLQKSIDAGLAEAERQPQVWQRAWALRRTLDQVRTRLNQGSEPAPEKMPMEPEPLVKPPKKQPAEKPPAVVPPIDRPPDDKKPAGKEAKDVKPVTKQALWDRLGGKAKVTKIVDEFTTLAAADPKVNFTRNGKYPLTDADVTLFKQGMVEFISSATGGPLLYTGKNMKQLHKGMNITNAEFNAAAEDLKAALEDNGVTKADSASLLAVVETTRKDIVEEPADTKPAVDKKPATDKKPAKKPAAKTPPAKTIDGKTPTEVSPLDKSDSDKKPRDIKPADKEVDDTPPAAVRGASYGDVYGQVTFKGQMVAGVTIPFVAAIGSRRQHL